MSLKPTIESLRKDYAHGDPLLEENANADPIQQFDEWMRYALETKQPEPNAMALATVNAEGQPSCRYVLLRGYDAQGFAFFTNYQSAKGHDLAQNPKCAATIWWEGLERQVRITGVAELLSAKESDEYFFSRPIGSRIGAWTSPQSQVLAGGREELERLLNLASAEYGTTNNIPRPGFWGGYLIRPTQIEFWQGRSSRLHDRLLYTPNEGGWKIERLAP